MTDYERFKTLFTDMNIPFIEKSVDIDGWSLPRGTLQLNLEVEGWDDDDAVIIGYTMFVTEFYFNPEGTFLKVGLWE